MMGLVQYSEHSKTRWFSFLMVIFRTQFVSNFQMVMNILFPVQFLMVPLAHTILHKKVENNFLLYKYD
jgi:hypothetical protein